MAGNEACDIARSGALSTLTQSTITRGGRFMSSLSFRKVIVVGTAISLFAALPIQNVSAKKIRVPDAPTIVVLKSTKIKTQLQRLSVQVAKPTNDGGSAVIDMTVQIFLLTRGGKEYRKSCVIKARATSCTFNSIPVFDTTAPRIHVVARNKVGTSKRSAFHSFPLRDRIWVKPGYKPSGSKLPSTRYKQSNARVLTRDNVVKWRKFQALRRTFVSGASIARLEKPKVVTPTVTFTVTGVVGLALPEQLSSAPASGMFAVKSDGTPVDSLAQGSLSASIRDFYSAPNSRFYVTFTSPTAVVQGGPLCILAEVDSSTGVSTCVDSSITSVGLTTGSNRNPPIQFDSQGNVYYFGILNSKFVLRKSVNGQITNLINDNISMQDFIVLGDGGVLIAGTTQSSGTRWFRKLSPANELTSIVTQNTEISFLARFPDGNVYFGYSDGTGTGIKRYLTATNSIDSRDWVARKYYTVNNPYQLMTFCSGALEARNPTYPTACQQPHNVTQLMTTANGQVLAVVGTSPSTKQVVSLYPTVEPVATAIATTTLVYQFVDKIVIAGSNGSGTNMLTVYDPASYQETVIIDQSNETEIYSVAYVPTTGKLLFNGLRFSDNSVVVGEVDMP